MSDLEISATAYHPVLFVDDDALCRCIAKYTFEKTGVSHLIASDGLQAKYALEKNPFSLVLTDIFMPEMDGLELTDFIKANNLGIPVFVMSGVEMCEGMSYADVGKKYGADFGLEKPLTFAKLNFVLTHRATITAGRRMNASV